ncbi:MAG: hypothetical protein PHV23_06105 [Candidatus Gracilibacteria bacterium]|nr:hypothetical protein [Candidatus Gracilibacteria bacterium]
MNIYLHSLFEKYKLSEKDRYEISQIYGFLPIEKKQNLIENFELVAAKIIKIEETLELEKEILIGNSVERIKNSILENRKQKIDAHIKREIDLLKGEI